MYKSSRLGSNNKQRPFSEYETRSVRYVLHKYRPKIQLSVHSGCFSVMTAPAFKYPEESNIQYDNLKKVSKSVASKFCNCKNGPVSSTLN